MTWIDEVWQRIRLLGRHSALDSGLDEEIRFPLEQQTEKNRRAGTSPEDPRRRAMVTFGGALLEDSTRDIRYGVRALRRAPGFTIVVDPLVALRHE